MELKRDIKYIDRNFDGFRSRLIDYSKTYFPQTYNDFSPSSLGMMFIEQSSYIGDVLSFYLDNQLQENFIQYTQQYNNIFELAYMFGYKPKISHASQVDIDIYQQLPSKTVSGSIVPDYDYTLKFNPDFEIQGNNFTSFLIQDGIDFSKSSSLDPTEVTVYQISGDQPQYYLLKKTRKAISATIISKNYTFDSFSPFPTIPIQSTSFLKILDVSDENGNLWYEVDNLGQEMVFDSIKNTNLNDPNRSGNTPNILKLKKVQRRFTTKIKTQNTIELQFGSGNVNDTTEEITPNPNNVGLGLPFKQDKLTSAYSPTNFLFTGTYGIAPSNTTLIVRYLEGGGGGSNVEANSITNTSNSRGATFNKFNLNSTISNYIFNSISANNPKAATGGGTGDTITQIRQNTLANIASQKRSVTTDDYLIRALSMPSDYGTVSKAYIEKPKLTDTQISTIETLSLYVLSTNYKGQLEYAGNSLKENLKTYLSQYRMIGDNIEIRDAYIIDIALDFEIIVLPNFNNNEVLSKCIESLKGYFNINEWQLNQPILLRDLYIRLDRVEGVQTVKNIKIINKAGTLSGYSQYAYDIDAATQNQVIYPSLDPSIFEIRYPDKDIKGRVVPL